MFEDYTDLMLEFSPFRTVKGRSGRLAQWNGKVIKERAKKLKIKLYEVADAVGVCDNTLHRWTSGKGIPNFQQLVTICDLLSLEVADFLKRKDDKVN